VRVFVKFWAGLQICTTCFKGEYKNKYKTQLMEKFKPVVCRMNCCSGVNRRYVDCVSLNFSSIFRMSLDGPYHGE